MEKKSILKLNGLNYYINFAIFFFPERRVIKIVSSVVMKYSEKLNL